MGSATTYENPSPSRLIFAVLASDSDQRQDVCEDRSKGGCDERAHVEEGDSASGLVLLVPRSDNKDGARKD